jgi:16S rRNA (cytosine967-C5)-methyltransferase
MIPLFLRKHIQNVLTAYDGGIPLSDYLKTYFKSHPEAGSRDRRMVAEVVYHFYRCVRGFDPSVAETCDLIEMATQATTLISGLQSGAEMPANFDVDRMFTDSVAFSNGISRSEWLASMLRQPLFFIRLRQNPEKLKGLLAARRIEYSEPISNVLSMEPGAKLDDLLPPSGFVVQDLSSRQTGEYMNPQKGESWWDACAGAGGKSLLLADKMPGVRLTVSDKRKTILHNLRDRFRRYGLPEPTALVADVSESDGLAGQMGDRMFDHILCDVPCSGSGTWARTPENFYFFRPGSEAEFHLLQTQIAGNVVRYLKPGGTLIYITCSVFRQENEDVVDRLVRDHGLRLLQTKLIKGIDQRADCMFVAVLARS